MVLANAYAKVATTNVIRISSTASTIRMVTKHVVCSRSSSIKCQSSTITKVDGLIAII
jgi:hypothetical protein